MKRRRFMRANPQRGLQQSRCFSTTSLTIGRKKPPSFASRKRTAKPVLPLETCLILNQEPVEMMEKHPVEDDSLRMSRTIDSRQSRRIASRCGQLSRIGPRLPGKNGRSPGLGEINPCPNSPDVKHYCHFVLIDVGQFDCVLWRFFCLTLQCAFIFQAGDRMESF